MTVRLSLIVVTLLMVSIAIFVITEILPGDVATKMLGQFATEQNVKNLREELGLDRSAPARYLSWIKGVVQGDFGDSLVQRRAISEIVTHRLWPSLILAGAAFLIAMPLAVLIGIWAGVRPDSKGDRVVSALGMVGISLPEFVTGLLLMIIFSSTLHWLPSTSSIARGDHALSDPKILVLPVLTLTAVLFAYVMRMTRANVIEVMESPYVRTAILKGLPMRRVLIRHVVPNAMLPTISVVAANAGWLLGGLIIVENVFAYPGLGQLLLSSILTRDTPLLQAVTLIIAGAYTVANLIADLSYGFLDPRIRVG